VVSAAVAAVMADNASGRDPQCGPFPAPPHNTQINGSNYHPPFTVKKQSVLHVVVESLNVTLWLWQLVTATSFPFAAATTRAAAVGTFVEKRHVAVDVGVREVWHQDGP